MVSPWKKKMLECAIRLTSAHKIPNTTVISGGSQLIRKDHNKNPPPLKMPRCAKAIHFHAFNLLYLLHEFHIVCLDV